MPIGRYLSSWFSYGAEKTKTGMFRDKTRGNVDRGKLTETVIQWHKRFAYKGVNT